eukprot:PhF_6_TR18651/c0_g1_i1/m.27266
MAHPFIFQELKDLHTTNPQRVVPALTILDHFLNDAETNNDNFVIPFDVTRSILHLFQRNFDYATVQLLETITELGIVKEPIGITSSPGNTLLCCSWPDSILQIDPADQSTSVFWSPEGLDKPLDLTFASNTALFVSCEGTGKLVLLRFDVDKERRFKVFDGFHCVRGVSYRNEQLALCHSDQKEVMIYNVNLETEEIKLKLSIKHPDFRYPTCLCWVDDECIACTDFHCNTVFLYNVEKDTCLWKIEAAGCRGITCVGDIIIVACDKKLVFISKEGVIARTFGLPGNPRRLCGYGNKLYVTRDSPATIFVVGTPDAAGEETKINAT